jgi:hypothetical protein
LSHVELLHDFPRLGVMIANRGGVRMMVHFPIRIYYRINSKRLGAELDGSEYWHVAVFCSERATGELKLNRLTAIVTAGTTPPLVCLKKLGFRAEGLAISLAMSVNVWALTPDMVKNPFSTIRVAKSRYRTGRLSPQSWPSRLDQVQAATQSRASTAPSNNRTIAAANN